MKVSVIESNYKENMSALFWDITLHLLVNVFRRFGATYRFHLQG